MKEIRVSYTVQELRTLLPRGPKGRGYDDRTIRRWLRKHNVPLDKIGRDLVVWISDLVVAFPQLEKSIEIQRSIQE